MTHYGPQVHLNAHPGVNAYGVSASCMVYAHSLPSRTWRCFSLGFGTGKQTTVDGTSPVCRTWYHHPLTISCFLYRCSNRFWYDFIGPHARIKYMVWWLWEMCLMIVLVNGCSFAFLLLSVAQPLHGDTLQCSVFLSVLLQLHLLWWSQLMIFFCQVSEDVWN